MHEEAALKENVPTAQASQLLRSELECVPALQEMQVAAPVPLTKPASHSSQADIPVAAAFFPATQSVQEDAPWTELIVPAAQSTQADWPVLAWALPKLQLEQAETPGSSRVARKYLPARQSEQVDAPSPLKEPEPQ